MRHPTVSQGLKLCGLIAVTAGLFVAWSVAPVLEIVGFHAWRFVGALGAGMVGIIGVPFVASWPKAVVAIGVGLLVGVLFTELAAATDVSLTASGLVEAVEAWGLDLATMFVAAASGAAAVRWLSSRYTA